jgi:hypothetical protein
MDKLFSIARSAGILTLIVFIGISCDSSNSSDPELDVMPINSVTVDGVTVSLFSDKELETGTNDLYWKVEEGNSNVAVKSFSIMPMMDMGQMQHSTPHTDPVAFEENDSYFHNMAAFIMPSGEMGSWDISFEIETQTGEMINGNMPVEIASSWKLTSVRDTDDNIYFISWMSPQKPVSGNNDLKFMVHTRETMMSFPAVSDAELIIYPYMDMGGGSGHSTEFTVPEAMGDGIYEGDINYSMSGTWTTSVQIITAQNDTLPEVVFEYSVQAK